MWPSGKSHFRFLHDQGTWSWTNYVFSLYHSLLSMHWGINPLDFIDCFDAWTGEHTRRKGTQTQGTQPDSAHALTSWLKVMRQQTQEPTDPTLGRFQLTPYLSLDLQRLSAWCLHLGFLTVYIAITYAYAFASACTLKLPDRVLNATFWLPCYREVFCTLLKVTWNYQPNHKLFDAQWRPSCNISQGNGGTKNLWE